MVRSAFFRIYLPIALLSFPLAGIAQGTYQVKSWGYEDGLPTQTVISDILQSPEGYLWLSTPSGIIRFDGIDFRLLDKTNSRLEANSILTFFEDSEERWWYGTADKGFGAFSEDTTLTFPKPGYVTTFAEMPQGTLWIGTNGNGLWKIDLEAYRLIPQRVFPDKVGLYIDELSVGPSNELYIASGKGLFTIRKDSIIAHLATQGISILSVWPSPDGSVWYSTEEGLHQLKNKLSRHIAFPSQPKRSLIQQVKGYRGGVLALTDYALYLYQKGIMKSIFETDNKILVSMETDHEGGIWLGTEVNGLIRLTPAVISMLGEENGLAGKIASVITQSREETIYIGTTSGLTILDADSSTVQTLFEGSLVTSVLADRRNRIWVALRGQGIRLLEGTNVRSFTAEEGWLSTAIWTLYEDEGGRIWAGSPLGVSTYSTEHGWQANNAVNEKLLHNDVRAIYRAQSGALWIGTSYGLHAFHEDKVHVYATEHGLKSAVILDIAETNDSTLWIATKDGGLHRFKEGRIKSVPESLTGPKISRIIPVGEYLWLAGGTTIIGIKSSALNRWLDQDEHLTLPDHIRFGQDDGLEGEIMGTIQPSGRQMKNGELWLPTSRGVATFKPDAENLRLPPPPVTINYMIIGTDTLNNPSALKIPHTRNRIDISYTGFSFTNPEAVSYFYRMADFDQQWNRVGNRRMAIYTSLPPGDYQFEVKAQIGDGPFSSEIASVPVMIIPAFYETVWFRTAVVIVILLTFWGGYTYRINAMKRLERLRVRIANDLHDEIASNLGSIVLRSRLLIQSKSLAGEQQQHLAEIDRMSRRTAVSMRDIIWLINPDKDRVDDLQSKLKQVTGQLLVDISFEFNTKRDGRQQEISLKVRRNTVFIYKEILHNIVKHADASSVKIDFGNHQKEINLMVKDDGNGFNTDGLTDDGIGLESMQKRADDINARLQINSSMGKGTCVSITIPIT